MVGIVVATVFFAVVTSMFPEIMHLNIDEF